MRIEIAGGALELVDGDITAQSVDAIINAANAQLAGGGGVDGAIHRAGGPSIMEACRKIGGCPTGSAVATTAGDLPARQVIHAVGPVYHGGRQGEAMLLAAAYNAAFSLAAEMGLRRVASPALSTGAYGYPMEEAAVIATKSAAAFLESGQLDLVRFVLWGKAAHLVWVRAAGRFKSLIR